MYTADQIDQVAEVFGELDDALLDHMYGRLSFFADTMLGRYAGSMLDRLAHTLPVYVTARGAPNAPAYAHVEIGTMFGGSVLAKLDVLQMLEKDHRVVAIDPLEGYYDRGPDPETGLPVDEPTFWANVVRFGFSADRVHLAKCRSDDPAARQAVAGRRVLTLFIDGDHSYEGVRSDWLTFGPTVAPDGYVIFDDYDERAWPEVTRYVDELMASLPEGWRKLGVIDTALIIQRHGEGGVSNSRGTL